VAENALQPHFLENDRLVRVNEFAAACYRKILSDSPIAAEARSYVERRGITPDLLEKFGIGFAPDAWDTLAGLLENRAETVTQGNQEQKRLGERAENTRSGTQISFFDRLNAITHGETFTKDKLIDAKGKKVVVIGGGDTGADCMGTAHRQGAACVVQIEVLSKPPECRSPNHPWPVYPSILKTTSSHEEGGERHWEVTTKRFIGEKGSVKKLSCVKAGGEFEIEADMVILAVGFIHPEHPGLLADLNVGLNERGNVKTDPEFMTSVDKVFSAGDMRRGQSLVVWAISEGRSSADCIDKYLMGEK